MCEIGSYMGESTLIFASQMIFDEIHCIEPFVVLHRHFFRLLITENVDLILMLGNSSISG